ncbi:MAG TPA: hypothetical protein VHZ55_33160, partial [Bryobacteraceae bacterium]|nr:hypothetical protein [Bryobacteraceae bacterium]
GVDSSNQRGQSSRIGLDQELSASGSLIIAAVIRPTATYTDLRRLSFRTKRQRDFCGTGLPTAKAESANAS